jgi:hypothetical protein
MEPAEQPRPMLVQFSLQSLMVLIILMSLALGIYRQAGVRALATYGLLLFAVGPWFSYLASECLPIRTLATRRTLAHLFMLLMFAVGLWSAQQWQAALEFPVAAWVLPAALVLWVPQYLAYFVVQRDED